MLRIPKNKTILNLGLMAEEAAVRYGANTITLDEAMDALPEAGRRFTVARFADLVAETANRLWAAGVRTRDHVVIHKTNSFDITLFACAAARIGAVPVMLSAHLDGPTVEALLRRLKRPALLTDAAKLDGELAGAPLAELTSLVLSATGARPGATALADLAGAPVRPAVVLDPDEPAMMTHTSGTTGIPKLVVHSSRSIGARYLWQDRVVRLLRKREAVLMHISYVHSRLYPGIGVLLKRNKPMVFLNDASPERLADALVEHRPGVLETHPNSFLECESILDDPRRPISSVRFFNSTFDAIHPGTMHKFLQASERRSPVFLQVYGQSECGPLIARPYTRGNVLHADGRCQGYPAPGITRYRLVPRNGQPATRETPGYIDVSTAGRALGYYGEEERFQQQVHGEWWRGGDVGYRTKWGCLHLLDREVDVIPTIHSTLEVEDVLLHRLPELTELVIVPGRNKEPLPVVCTRGDAPIDLDRWRAAVADQAAMADPVQLRLDELPRTATAKIKRLELASRLTAAREPQPAGQLC
ncbi:MULTISPECIES: AMP-binding protein [Kitasatospora]|uniref:Putative acyl-CoA synthetase n=1 Tax=Kitasatospora setae (strain ATCC 33774 / DSM 43861 / JCM 3304 / KCC A-0304 / NBRC 14216 / KM-6054) TaxID=452652 RepID=E4N0H6_KITSK|nr:MULTISPECIES: AMP-binding protein [Kitasatospora]BAJ31660.1 putative acyl-CoA synthetase [Kitasatospora setae KM-6054]